MLCAFFMIAPVAYVVYSNPELVFEAEDTVKKKGHLIYFTLPG